MPQPGTHPLRERVTLALLLLGVFILHLLTLRPGLDWGDDFAIYLAHAINLVHFHAYGDTGYVLNPYFPVYAPSAYPPGFPLLLAPLVAAVPPAGAMPDLYAYKTFVTLFLIAALYLVDRFLRPHLPSQPMRLAVLACIGLNPYLLGFKNAILSDIPYLALSFLAIVLVQRMNDAGAEADAQASAPPDAPASRKPSTLLTIAAALAIVLAVQTRSIGIVLLAAFFLSQLRGHRLLTPATLAVGATYLASKLLVKIFGMGSTGYLAAYTVYLEDPLAVVSAQLQLIPRFHYLAIAGIWQNPWGVMIGKPLAVFCMALALAGLLVRFRRGPGFADFYVLLYMAVLFTYASPQDFRLLIPVIPFFFFYIAVALRALARRGMPRLAAGVGVALVAVTVVCSVAQYPHVQRESAPGDLTAPMAREALDFLRTQTQPADLVLCSKPRAVALLTGRRATPVLWAEDPEYVWSQLREMKPKYLLLGKPFLENESVMLPWARHYGSVFTPVFSNESYWIFRVEGDAIPLAPPVP